MSEPKDWWREEASTRPGPARIRVSFNREFTHAEREHLRRVGRLIAKTTGDRFRLSNDRIYIESKTYESRALYDAVAAVVASSFVNVFPLAVRTFRELVKPVGPTPSNYLQGGVMTKGTATFNSPGPVQRGHDRVKSKLVAEYSAKHKKGKKKKVAA